jgi:hypothetical protein
MDKHHFDFVRHNSDKNFSIVGIATAVAEGEVRVGERC